MVKYLLLLATTLLSVQFSHACELTMGYRTNAKPPFIADKPDNSGLYRDLYTEATQRIGCSLKVIRQPKGRIMHLIDAGEIDFYPGLSFTKKRAEYVSYIGNGLKDGNIGLTRKDEQEVLSLHDVAERNMVMVVSYGGYDHNAADYGIHLRKPHDYTLGEIVDLILNDKADFHAYNLLAVQYYLKNNPEKAKQLKVHLNCCDVAHRMYLGFSKKSDNIRLIPNPDYDPTQAPGPENTEKIADPASIAGRLEKALADMQTDGSFQRIHDKYFAIGQ